MILDLIDEITILDVIDRGVANMERIALRINAGVNMGQYGLLIGVRSQDGAAWPLADNFYWFGEGLVVPGDCIFVYTGPGQPRKEKLPNVEQHIYSVHWGRKNTVFVNKNLAPILFRMDAVMVPPLSAKALEKT